MDPQENRRKDSWSNPAMGKSLCLLALFFTIFSQGAFARQDPFPVRKAVEEWLKIQTHGLPGQVTYEVGGLDPDNQLIPCPDFDVSRQAGARPWGRSNVLVRCLGEAGWRIYLPVHIRVKAEHLISARPIPQGQIVTTEDIATQVGDLSELPASTLTDPALAIGKTAVSSIPAGRPLRSEMLKAAIVIRQGQSVRVVSHGPGFSVSNEGRALNNATEGQPTQVRLTDGQVVSGIARSDGSVQIGY